MNSTIWPIASSILSLSVTLLTAIVFLARQVSMIGELRESVSGLREQMHQLSTSLTTEVAAMRLERAKDVGRIYSLEQARQSLEGLRETDRVDGSAWRRAIELTINTIQEQQVRTSNNVEWIRKEMERK